MFTKIKETTIRAGLILLTMIMFTTVVQAQETGSIAVTTTVLPGLSIEAEQNLRFGDIISGETKRVNLDGTATGSQPGDEQAGIFKISTLGNFSISFTDVPSFMVGSEAGNAGELLPVTFFSAWGTDMTTPDEGRVMSLASGTPIVINGTGEQSIFVFLGAEVNPPISQPQGTYEITITITATFGID
jgi:hypothetical protein